MKVPKYFRGENEHAFTEPNMGERTTFQRDILPAQRWPPCLTRALEAFARVTSVIPRNALLHSLLGLARVLSTTMLFAQGCCVHAVLVGVREEARNMGTHTTHAPVLT